MRNTEKVREPWTLDAHNYTDPARVLLIESPETEEFLSNPNVLGIVAPKGMGKTFLLRRKSQYLRDNESGVFFPKKDPCEKFDRLSHDFSLEAVDLYRTPDKWKILWCTSIAAVILYGIGERVPVTLARMFGIEVEMDKAPAGRKTLTVESALAMLLMRKPKDYQDFYATELKPAVSALNDRVFVFLDNIDEGLDKQAGNSLVSSDSARSGSYRSGALSASIWTSAQLGLLSAMRDLYLASSRRVRVYASLRKEAIDANEGALALQESDLYTELRADKVFVEEIFRANIEAMRRQSLVSPDAADPYERFLGFSHIPHSRVTKRSGEPALEHVFDFLYRHSFGRPRELMEMGKAISRERPASRTYEKVRGIAANLANTFFEQYKKEMIPYWDPQYEELMTMVTTNVLPERAALTIFDRLSHELPHLENPFTYYISRGLIGTLQVDGLTDNRVITFRPAGSYIAAPIANIGENSYYFVHPCLEVSLRKKSEHFSPDTRQIVGDGEPFTREPEMDVLHIRCR